jgi:hypothetical protein
MNLELYQSVLPGLTQKQRDMLPHCFLGALSNCVAEDIWQRCLDVSVQSARILCPEPSSEIQNEKENDQYGNRSDS